MADQKKPVDRKPYETHQCQGRYMETGQPWAGEMGESLCMMCDVNFSCWKLRQERTDEPREAPKESGMSATITIQIGNSDDKLTQVQWCSYVLDVENAIKTAFGRKPEVHFTGGSEADKPWQNYCWVFAIPARDLVTTLQVARAVLAKLAAKHNQDSIAMTVGKTEFVEARS